MADPRTFKVDRPALKGEDVQQWQQTINSMFAKWDIDLRVKVDGEYGLASRSATATLLYALGIEQGEMKDGVTPGLRVKVRNYQRKLSPKERARFAQRVAWRRRLRQKWARGVKVARPVNKIITSAWGYHKGVHDGIDVQTPPAATVYAMVKSRVIDVRAGGWWGRSPSGDVSKGDGIVQLEVLETVGPFTKGMHIGYGHCEHACVREGQIVEAGEPVARVGLAVTWHTHLMVNDGQTTKGIGTRDPRKLLDFAMRLG